MHAAARQTLGSTPLPYLGEACSLLQEGPRQQLPTYLSSSTDWGGLAKEAPHLTSSLVGSWAGLGSLVHLGEEILSVGSAIGSNLSKAGRVQGPTILASSPTLKPPQCHLLYWALP